MLNDRNDTFTEYLDGYEFTVNIDGRNETCFFIGLF